MRQLSNLSVNEILESTGGILLNGDLNIIFNGITDDTRVLEPKDVFIALKGKKYDGHAFVPEAIKKGATGVIINQDYSFSFPKDVAVIAVNDTLKALGKLAYFKRKKHETMPLVAITGSSGKTTTKEAIAHILAQKFKVLKSEGNYNNQIGLPFTLLGLSKSYDIACVELGTNAPGEIGYLSWVCQPDVGVITSIQPAHLEGLKSIEAIQKEKGSLLQHVKKCFIYNADDIRVEALADSFNKEKISFGLNKGEIRAKDIVAKKTLHFTLILPEEEIFVRSQLLGKHQIYALLAAAAVGWYFGLPLKFLQQALESFSPLSGRLCLRITSNGFYLLDDTYNANPGSMQAALETLKQFNGNRIAVLGDMLELGEVASFWHKEVGKWAASTNLKALILFGDYADFVKKGAIEAGMDEKKIYLASEKEDIVSIIHNIAKASDIILLKASRGMGFEKVIEKLEERT